MKKRVLISYDIPADEGGLRAKVSRIVFGSTVTRTFNGHRRTYRYEGILEQSGALYVGQSVLLLTPSLGERLAAKLRTLRVTFTRTEVYVPS